MKMVNIAINNDTGELFVFLNKHKEDEQLDYCLRKEFRSIESFIRYVKSVKENVEKNTREIKDE